ncbi:putative swi snf and rsc complexes subunit arp9 protein [Botrytis fragariae]|uniref:Putative swi snf and rsc complexes subunit arp9 protein n=1 Tax=Botrytis fragariae TaxID=1964551 RepID=A0A8H6B3Z2_9HELO|nr:putative swi snf and rsc complexes subunit arp9 protein [Botrytis fragariae]KAF5878577.1 putative swi snf and rsc complexes subunit arp9 protein [Botrytis fragariae]
MKPPSRPVRKATSRVTKPTSKASTKKKNITNAKTVTPQPEAAKSIVTNPVDRIYKTVTLENNDIEDGLWMMRRLGNGKYEAVNLNDAAFEDICSEENEARMASSPKSVEVFKASQKSIKDVSLKLDRAIFTASGKVFRFKKLPIELRYKIYEYALISETGLHPGYASCNSFKLPGVALGLLASCRSINAECTQFLWKNTFDLNACSIKRLREVKDTLIQNARNFKYEWSGSGSGQSKDMLILGILASCEHIDTLHLILWGSCVDGRRAWYNRKPQHMYQNDPTVPAVVQKFNKSNGFDKLFSLHDLKKVIVTKHWTFTDGSGFNTLTDVELKAFEKFLNDKLTTPVAPPVVIAHLPSTPTRKSTRILKNAKPLKYVPDPVSEDEEGFWDEDEDEDGDDDGDDEEE